MSNRQTKNLKKSKIDFIEFFQNPSSPRQKQYELIRAIMVDNLSIDEA